MREEKEALIALGNKLKAELVTSNHLLQSVHTHLKWINQDEVTLYLGKIRASHVTNDERATIDFIKDILSKIEPDENDKLNDFEDKLIIVRKSLKELSKDIYAKETDIKLLENEISATKILWDKEYLVLKQYTKGDCLRFGIDYRMFFYDLKYKVTSNSSSSKDKESNEAKEEDSTDDNDNNIVEE